MITVPTTTVTILGGATTQDAYGDVADGTTELATGVPMAIHAGREIVTTESEVEARIVRYYTGRAPSWVSVTGGERIRDDRTGDIYLIDNVTVPQSAISMQDVRLDLRRIT